MMRPAIRCALALALACACAVAGAPAGLTSRSDLDALFELEGNAPFSQPYDGTLTFSALASRFASAHGHGWRNELKIAAPRRHALARTHEHFSAIVTPTLPDGAKTIVAQYHVEGLDTILKVVVQDSADAHAFDGKAGNGVFDVVARILGEDGRERETALATLRSGEQFRLEIRVDGGVASVGVDGAAHGAIRTAATHIPGDGRKVYFKFGDYAQALDPASGKPTSSPADWDAWFRAHHIDAGTVRFQQVVFVRD